MRADERGLFPARWRRAYALQRRMGWFKKFMDMSFSSLSTSQCLELIFLAH